MTVRNKLEKMLIANGMSDQQASEVMDLAIPEINNTMDEYQVTFDSPASDYPNVMFNIFYSIIKPIALKWIDANKPQAWFREMFNN